MEAIKIKVCYIYSMSKSGTRTIKNYKTNSEAVTMPKGITSSVYYPYKKRYKLKNSKKKKSFVSVILSLCIWSGLFYFACSSNIKSFIEPVYINRLNNKYLNLDTKQVITPTLNYMTNLNLMGENLLDGAINQDKTVINKINSSGELYGLKNDILYIINQYKNLHAGVYIYDYSSGKTVEINADEVFPAASIIKIPVLLELFNRSETLEKEGYSPIDTKNKITFKETHRTEGSGNLQYKNANVDYTIDYLANIMITKSDNSATNMLIEQIGGINGLNSSLRQWGFSKTQMTSWLPDLKGTNTTTPKDIATMLYNIDNRDFLSLASSADIKQYMSHVENRTLIKSQLPNNAVLMHKTGDIGKMLGDAGIIYSPAGKKFLLVTMVKRPHNDYGARELIQKITKAAYQRLG